MSKPESLRTETQMDPHLVKMFLSILCLAFAAHLIQGFRPQNDCQDPGTNCLLLRTTEENKSYKPGTKLNYYCPHKFTLKGSRELVCRRDGTWSASLPECIAPKCLPAILPPHTQVRSPMKNRRDYGIRFTLSCDYGYTSTQRGTLVCDPPEWKLEPSTFKCFPVTCSFLQNPTNGYLTSNSQQYDSIVQYHCNYGYHLNGSPSRRCQKDGTWSGNEPVCEIKSCQDPGTPRKGSKRGNLQVGQTLHFSCDHCYELRGSPTRTCQSDLNWSGHQPTCTGVTCSLLQNPANGYLTSNSQQCDSIVQYHCNYGYHLNGSPRRHCQSDGTWSGNAPVCEIKSCQDPGTPRKGSKKGNLQVGQTLHFSCDHCYQLRGSPTRTCQSDLSWSGHQPTCTSTDVTCSLLQNPANGYMNSNSQQCDSIVQYRCNYGYQLNGSPSRRCQRDGTWSGNEPVCENPNPNIALGKPASMSSHWAKHGGPAAIAVDGKRVGRLLSTNIEYGSWVKIDLLREETVSTVIVVNRRDCCVIRINDFKVSVGNNGKKPRKNAKCGRRSRAKSGPMIIQCPTPLRGRYVTVYMPKIRYTTMALSEVEVYRRRQEE